MVAGVAAQSGIEELELEAGLAEFFDGSATLRSRSDE